jgi:DNA-binding transcriptional LysR family regulator
MPVDNAIRLWGVAMVRSSAVTPINLQLLAQFEALVQERHVSRAAERMGVGQSTMSAALARLRILFDDPLLVRTAKGMVPTPKALELAKRAHQALELLEPNRVRSKDFDPATSTRQFRILATEGLALLFTPPIAAFLRKHAPGVRLLVQPADMRHTVEALRDQECDVTISNILHAPPDLRKTLVYPQRACCIVSATHPEIRARMTMKQYLKYPHVLWGAETVSYRSMEASVAQALTLGHHYLPSAMRVPNILIVPAVVAATDMIATVPIRIANEAASSLAIRIVKPPFKLADPDISMYWHELSHRDPGHIWFRSAIQDIAKTLRTEA